MSFKPVVLLAFSNDTRLDRVLDLDKECAALKEALKEAEEKEICEIRVLMPADLAGIYEIFTDEHYKGRIAAFHFAGHADGYQLLLESKGHLTAGEHQPQIAYAGGLVDFFRRQPNLNLIFLNGCSTLEQAEDLFNAGIQNVIGTSDKIPDAVSIDFARRFYASLGQGLPVEHAMQDAESWCKTLHSKGRHRSLFYDEEDTGKVPTEIPWKLRSRNYDWSLAEAGRDPLFGLPPVPDHISFPPAPFSYLKRYQESDARVFWGRGREIRQLMSLIVSREHAPLILFNGESGVGKSAVLRAGLFPRLSGFAEKIVYVRRDARKGLTHTLLEALQEENHGKSNKTDTVHSVIREILSEVTLRKPVAPHPPADGPENPFFLGPPVVIMVDQLEEAFISPYSKKRKKKENAYLLAQRELTEFLDNLAPVLLESVMKENVRIILGFRKEYFRDVQKHVEEAGLKWEDVFLEPLDQRGIEEVVLGLHRSEVKRQYHTDLELGEVSENKYLPTIIAQDLLEDQDSAIAPILQILMTSLWNSVSGLPEEKRLVSVSLYQSMKKTAIHMDKFFEGQIAELAKTYPREVHSGRVLDILYFHTSEVGTAISHTFRELNRRYLSPQDQEKEQESFRRLILDLDRSHLLRVEGEQVYLVHDTLAPLIREKFEKSSLPGQQAYRLLHNKLQAYQVAKSEGRLDEELGVNEVKKTPESVSIPRKILRGSFSLLINPEGFVRKNIPRESKVLLDETELSLVTRGRTGMPHLTEGEKELILQSKEQKRKRARGRAGARLFNAFLTFCIGVGVFTSIWFVKEALQARRSNEVITKVRDSLSFLYSGNEKASLESAFEAFETGYPQTGMDFVNQHLTHLSQEVQTLDTVKAYQVLEYNPSEHGFDISPRGQSYIHFSKVALLLESLWDSSIQSSFFPPEGDIKKAWFTGENRAIILFGDSIAVCDLNLNLLARAHVPGCYHAAVSPDGKWLVTLQTETKGSLWSLVEMREVRNFYDDLWEEEVPTSLSFSSESDRLLIGTRDVAINGSSDYRVFDDNDIYEISLTDEDHTPEDIGTSFFWDINGTEAFYMPGNADQILVINDKRTRLRLFERDGKYWALGWEREFLDGIIQDMKISPDGNILISQLIDYQNWMINIYNPQGVRIETLQPGIEAGYEIRDFAYLPQEERLLVFSNNGVVRLFPKATTIAGQIANQIEKKDQYHSLLQENDKRRMALVEEERRLAYWMIFLLAFHLLLQWVMKIKHEEFPYKDPELIGIQEFLAAAFDMIGFWKIFWLALFCFICYNAINEISTDGNASQYSLITLGIMVFMLNINQAIRAYILGNFTVVFLWVGLIFMMGYFGFRHIMEMNFNFGWFESWEATATYALTGTIIILFFSRWLGFIDIPGWRPRAGLVKGTGLDFLSYPKLSQEPHEDTWPEDVLPHEEEPETTLSSVQSP